MKPIGVILEDFSIVGKRVHRIEGVAKATGSASFCGDISLPGMVVGKILRSPYPHARLLHVDTSKAQRLKGVKAVICGKDTAGKAYGWFAEDEHALAIDKVRYIGDEVAAVAAVDSDLADEALELIKVDYEVLPAVFSPEEAMKPEAPRIHDAHGNCERKIYLEHGDVDEGFILSDKVFEDKFATQFVIHGSLEPHICVASWEPSGRLTVWATTQGPFGLRDALAYTLEIPANNIRVIKLNVGGGFGGKNEMLAVDFCAALLSMKAGKPVRIEYSRDEEFIATRRRHPLIIHIKTGVKKDGTLVAKYCKLIADAGAYGSRTPAIATMCGAWMNMQYRIPNWRFEGYYAYTNNPVTGAQRGWAAPTVRYADDSQMDIIAEKLGMSPVQIRLKNAVQSSDVTPNGFIYTSCGLTDCIKTVAEKSDFNGKWGKLPPYHGIGIACGAYPSGTKRPSLSHDTSAAVVELQEDGTAILLTGASDIGQGSDTALCQILAEELGVRFEDVRIRTGDTELVPMDLGTYASRVTLFGGNAVRCAAKDAKRQLFEVVAEILEANVEDIESRDGWVFVRGSPDRGISFSEGVKAALDNKGTVIVGRGIYNPSNVDSMNMLTGKGNIAPTYSFAAQVAEVEVDPLAGTVKVLKVTAAQDCGYAINPMDLEGQMEGSILQGIGQVLLEELITEKGTVLNPSFLDYRMPMATNMPIIETTLVQSNEREGPFGAKGVGEATQIPTAAAIANAIYNATGIRFRSIPITPDKIIRALSEIG